MERRELDVSADENLDYSLKLAIARDLGRLYASLLAEPVPSRFRAFIDRLGRALEQHAESPDLILHLDGAKGTQLVGRAFPQSSLPQAIRHQHSCGIYRSSSSLSLSLAAWRQAPPSRNLTVRG